eukprot:s219_g35.t1
MRVIFQGSPGARWRNESQGATKRIANASSWQAAMQLARSMAWDEGLISQAEGQEETHSVEGLKLDLFIFSALCAACGKRTAWTRAVGLLQTSLQEALGADVALRNSALSACGRQGHWRTVMLQVAGQSDANTVSMNCAVDAAGRGRAWRQALGWLLRMGCVRIDLSNALQMLESGGNIVAVNAAISAMGIHCRWEEAIHLLHSLAAPNLCSFNSASSACSTAGKWQHSLCLFDAAKLGEAQLSDCNIQLDVISYNSLINGCAVAGVWELALIFFWQMDACGLKPAAWIMQHGRPSGISGSFHGDIYGDLDDAVSFASMLDSMPGLQPQLASSLLELMWHFKAIDTVAFSAALRCYGKTGRWEMACRIWSEVGTSGLQLDQVISGAAADAFARVGHWKICVTLLRPKTTIITVNSACAAASAWLAASETMTSVILQALQPDLLSTSSVSTAAGRGRQWQQFWLTCQNDFLLFPWFHFGILAM